MNPIIDYHAEHIFCASNPDSGNCNDVPTDDESGDLDDSDGSDGSGGSDSDGSLQIRDSANSASHVCFEHIRDCISHEQLIDLLHRTLWSVPPRK